MAKAVFMISRSSIYDDLPEVRYHFPNKRYLKTANSCVGDWILYYETRMDGGSMSYIAAAQVAEVALDSQDKTHSYAYIKNYTPFMNPVPFKVGDFFYEETGRTGLVYVLTELDEIRNRLDEEYSSFYEPYIRSITQLKDGIDLDSASNWNSERADELEKDLEQFTELAQLGITIELVSHELERLDHTIGNHLRDLPPEVQQTKTFQSAFDAHTELMERLRFLSPLKLSGRSTSRTLITGETRGRFVHPWENHGITSRHAARFQTFPESFIFEGGLMAASKQIGNLIRL